MLTDLKPCPFCGAQPESPDVGDYFVECPSCGVQGPISNKDGQPHAKEEWNCRPIKTEVLQAQEPVAWFAFADSNGPVPLELWGFDQKACKHAVLENARSVGWKGTIEGYLFQKGWTIRPLVFPAPQPPAPCPETETETETEVRYLKAVTQMDAAEIAELKAKVVELEKESEYYRVNRDISGNAYLSMLNDRNELMEKVESLASYESQYFRDCVALQARVDELELYVGNLLARIHRDGGHYQAEHGNLKAVRAADIIVAKLNAQFDEQSALIEKCERALRDLTGMGFADMAIAAIAAIAAHKKGWAK